jgi:peptidoglycan/xylan/chitin deacetylase (PgdA/CDA1 family)
MAHPGRFDSASVIFVKRLLQRELPPAARSRIAGNLFERHVGVPEEVFSRDLYMSEDQLRLMLDCGMHIGAHGYGHQWMGSLTEDGQRYEITQSLAFLDRLGMGQNLRTFCYPYGDYSPGLLPLLESYGFRLGFTSVPAVADLDRHEFLTLPRLDTNDLPHRALIPGGTPETVSARAPA